MGKRLYSVFTDNMDYCYFTGTSPVERHHIFGGSRKAASEKRGFIVPLAPKLHPNGAHAGENAAVIDNKLKRMAQTYYESNYGNREQFIHEFGRSYL